MANNHNQIQYDSKGGKVFSWVNTVILILLCFVTIYPVYYVFCASFSESVKLLQNPGFMLWPQGWNMAAYRLAFTHPLLVSGYKNILFVMVIALPLNILLTLCCGYFLASKNVLFKPPIMR